MVVAATVLAACSGGSTGDAGRPDDDPTAPLRIQSLSGPAAFVTGGDAVVAVDSPAGDPLDGVTVTVDGRDVTDRFVPDDDPHRPAGAEPRLVALLDGLPSGSSTVTATRQGRSAALDLVDHDEAGPLFAGPHLSPFVCTTEPAGLGPAGPDCGAAPVVTWRYGGVDGQMHPLADPAALPADVATTTTSEGLDVPFVVRVETSVLDRSITTIAVLDAAAGPTSTTGPGPAAAPPGAPATWAPHGWNGRLVLRFGGGCGTTWSQGDVFPDALRPDLLGAGYAVASGSLTSFDTACDATLSAEVAMVVKEHVAETYGVPRHTIGTGGSGGAIQLLQTAQNYPGVLDALSPTDLFPDAVSLAAGVSDCGLLERWFGRDGGPAGIIPAGQPSGADLTDDQQRAVTGFATTATCALWTRTYVQTLDASEGCSSELVGQVYDRAVRPDGVRCTWQDGNVNVLGTDPGTGFAARPLDNVGVQYGLEALRAGVLSVDEFLDLNEHIGGFDLNGTWQPDRERASPEVLERAYAAGMVTAGTATDDRGAGTAAGAGGLVDVPIIALDSYTDPLGDIHDRQRPFALRQRLRTPDGADDPLLSIWTVPGPGSLATVLERFLAGTEDGGQPLVTTLDRWLSDAEEQPGDVSWAERLAAARPPAAEDRCTLPTGEVVSGPDTYAPDGPCARAYPTHSGPRRAAGAPAVDDVLACTLVELDLDGYGVALTDDQRDRFERVFPEGVCDWSRPGRGQQEPTGPWQVHDEP